jgi:hypothetical protein
MVDEITDVADATGTGESDEEDDPLSGVLDVNDVCLSGKDHAE